MHFSCDRGKNAYFWRYNKNTILAFA